MKALHFGAGNIGRGFIGKTLSESGYHVIFSDINQDIVDTINYNKEYSVRTVSQNKNNIVNIKNISAINFNDPEIIKIISSVNLITTAAGPVALDRLATIIARGIVLKTKTQKAESIQSLNIIACENKIQASSSLKKSVLENLSTKYYDYLEKHVGFVDCSIDTIIPGINNNTSHLIVEEFKEWIVNINQFKGEIPKIIDMQLSDNLNPFIERKFLTLNTGHAIAAYMGLIKKHKTIHDAILDKEIRLVVRSAMEESGAVLIKRYNFNKKDHISYICNIFSRFENPFLLDTLERIARNPLQKLRKEERLIKPLLGCVKYSLPYNNLAKGIAAALHYKNKNDLESIKIFSLIKNLGIKKTLFKICSLSENSKETSSIFLEYKSIFKNNI